MRRKRLRLIVRWTTPWSVKDGRPRSSGGSSSMLLALAEEADEPQLLLPCYDGLATVHFDLNDEGRVEEFMRKAQAVCERAGLEPDALVVLPFLD